MVAFLWWKRFNPLQNEICEEVDGDGGDVLILALKRVFHVAPWDAILIAHTFDGASQISVHNYCKQRIEGEQLDNKVILARLRQILSNVEVITADELLEFVDECAQFLAPFSLYCEVEVI